MRDDMFRILAVLVPGEADAGEILDRLEAAGGSGSVPAVPTFYRRLRDALESGWVEVVGLESPEGPGRPGQRYRLTAGGLQAARTEALRWRGFTDLVMGEAGP